MMAKKRAVKAKKITTNQASSLAYQGKVKFQVMRGERLISTKTYSNNGLPDLFRYLSQALAGIYNSALRPSKVALFNCSQNGEYEYPTGFNWTDAVEKRLLTEVSPYIVYDATPTAVTTATGAATTFRFKVPFNWLYKKTFNVIGLFTENNSPCAYFLCTSETAEGTKVWDPEDLQDVTGNYSLIIEWTMEVSNR